MCAQAELRKAYRREALKWHPDKSDAPKDEAEVQTRMLTYAPQPHQTGPTITPNHMAHDHTNTTLYPPHSRPHHTTHPPPRSTPTTRREKPAKSTPPKCVPPPRAL